MVRRPEQLDRLREGLNADFALGSTIERELVDHLAVLLLRRRRVPVVEAALLKRLMERNDTCDLSRLTDQELEQLEKIFERIGHRAERELSDVVDQGADGDRDRGLPRRAEMLIILARYETSFTNEIVKTVNLIHLLQARRIAAEEGARTVEATPFKAQLPAQACSLTSQAPVQRQVGVKESGRPELASHASQVKKLPTTNSARQVEM